MSRKSRLWLRTLVAFGVFIAPASIFAADEQPAAAQASTAAQASEVKAETKDSSAEKKSESSASESKPKYPPFATLFKDAEKPQPGLIPLIQKDNNLYAELSGSHFNRDYIVLISIAKGIGRGSILGGMSWGFGDDWIWQFRKEGEQVHVVRRNIRFKAAPGSPEEKAVKLAYTDSILYSLPIVTMGPTGGYIVDLTPIFMSDLPQISQALPGFSFSRDRSKWASVEGFPENIELQVAATYASGGSIDIDSVADSRGATINVHYSISALPQTGYRPRLADDRVGYFVTALKDYSTKTDEDRFVRYINRWHLEKADPSAEMSPPKKAIKFYIEKTVPFKYRAPIREGILEWNKAFEKIGIINAIEVVQQQENDDTAKYDPEDIRYNFFRWITSSAGFAMGPSRVNPMTGQILDADIIFDADFLQFWKTEYENFTKESIAAATGGPLDLKSYLEQAEKAHEHHHAGHLHRCMLGHGLSRELALGSTALMVNAMGPELEKATEKMIMQGLKEVTMHEVGHTLGLRHNFKASTFLSLEEMADPAKTAQTGLTASVMDYAPSNIAPKDKPQGDFFSTVIGPYDYWAIEYGYKPLSGGSPEGELDELKKIAARSGEPALAFATDEDTRGIDSDPLSNRFDLGKDPIEYAKQRAKLIAELWPQIVNRVTKEGEGYERARRAFGVLLQNHGMAVHTASRYIGGVHVNRSHKGDPNAQPPYVVVDVAKQREAMALLEEQIFSDQPFKFPPELYNHLASTKWSHWGMSSPLRNDYAIHDVIGMWQERVLNQLLSPLTLDRLHDSELKVPADKEAFTTAELVQRLTKAIFAETEKLASHKGEFTNRAPAISSLRRNLQRIYLKELATIAMGDSGAPQDTQTVAYAELASLQDNIKKALGNGEAKLDPYSKAHLTETSSRITKVLEADLQLSRP